MVTENKNRINQDARERDRIYFSWIILIVVSFIIGTVIVIIFWYPLAFLRIPIERFFEIFVTSHKILSTISFLLIHIIAFIILGIIVARFIQKKYSNNSILLTIPISFPYAVVNYIALSFGRNENIDLVLIILVLIPIISYITGLFICHRLFFNK